MTNHKEMFEKYAVFTSEDTSTLYNYSDTKEDAERLYSLSFHLQKRKASEREGINVPLWIDYGFSDN